MTVRHGFRVPLGLHFVMETGNGRMAKCGFPFPTAPICKRNLVLWLLFHEDCYGPLSLITGYIVLSLAPLPPTVPDAQAAQAAQAAQGARGEGRGSYQAS
jgi:hypothetical protein